MTNKLKEIKTRFSGKYLEDYSPDCIALTRTVKVVEMDDDMAIVKYDFGGRTSKFTDERIIERDKLTYFDDLPIEEKINFCFACDSDFTVTYSTMTPHGRVTRQKEFRGATSSKKYIFGVVFQKKSGGRQYVAQIEFADVALGLCLGTHKVVYKGNLCRVVLSVDTREKSFFQNN